MKDSEIISALHALEERARLAERKINYSSQLYRLEQKVKELEERLDAIQGI